VWVQVQVSPREKNTETDDNEDVTLIYFCSNLVTKCVLKSQTCVSSKNLDIKYK
jgi:hypothetical protein